MSPARTTTAAAAAEEHGDTAAVAATTPAATSSSHTTHSRRPAKRSVTTAPTADKGTPSPVENAAPSASSATQAVVATPAAHRDGAAVAAPPPPPPAATTTPTTTTATAAAVSTSAVAQARATRRAHAATSSVRSWCVQHKRALLLAGAAVSACVALQGSLVMLRLLRQARMAAFLRSLERDVVHVFIHPRWSHGPNLFPASVKVEAFLRLANLPYMAHFTNDSTMSPNGRLPFIVYNGTVLADSDFVVEYLSEQFAVTLDRALTPQAHAKGVLVRHLVETSLHYGLMRATFVDHPEFMTRVFADEFALEPLVAGVVVRSIRSRTITQLNTIGYGDLSQAVYEEELMRDVRAVETLLGEGGSGAFVCGGRTPSSFDCSVYAWAHICIELGACGNAALAYAAGSPVLRDYVQRVAKLAFGDVTDLHTAEAVQDFTQPRQATAYATTTRGKRAA